MGFGIVGDSAYTAKANGVEPYWYLRALFDQLPTFDPNGDYDELLPWTIAVATPEGFCFHGFGGHVRSGGGATYDGCV